MEEETEDQMYDPVQNDENQENIEDEEKENEGNQDGDDENTQLYKRDYRSLWSRRRLPADAFYKRTAFTICRNAFAFHRFDLLVYLLEIILPNISTPHKLITWMSFYVFIQRFDDDFMIKIMKKIKRFDVNKKEIILEVLIDLIKKGNVKKAKEFIEMNEFYLNAKLIRSCKPIDAILKGYISYMNYLDWTKNVKERRTSIYERFIQHDIMANKIWLDIQMIIKNSKNILLDIFVIILIDVLQHLGNKDDAFELLSIYMNNNKNHLNAHIYMYRFCSFHSEEQNQQFSKQEIDSLKAIANQQPNHKLVLELVKKNVETPLAQFEMLMEYIDYVNNNDDLHGWMLLCQNIKSFVESTERGRNQEIQKCKNQWNQFYKEYWNETVFHVKNIKVDADIQLLIYKVQVIQFLESSDHPFFISANQFINSNISLY